MLGLVVNESKVLEDILINNKLIEKHIVCINILIKHYLIKGETDKLNIQEKVIEQLEKCDSNFKRSQWEDAIKNTINRICKDRDKYKTEVKFIDVDSVEVTKSELDMIGKLGDKKLKKVAFILLVYAKISNNILQREDGWVSQSFTNIFKEAKVTANRKEKQLILHELYKREYISKNIKGSKISLRVNYLDNNSDVAIKIREFEGVVHEYLKYLGEKWKKCECCSNWITIKSNRTKYCKKCYSARELELTAKRVKKHRSNGLEKDL